VQLPRVYELLSQEKLEVLDKIVLLLSETLRNKKNIWIAGNGGSAATSDHFETDLLRFREDLPFNLKVKAFSLCANSSNNTAIANDIGFEELFAIQLKRKGELGDVCILISASGSSNNIVKAAIECRASGIKTIGLFGFKGAGGSESLIDILLCLDLPIDSYAEAENMHLSICHEIASRLRHLLN